MYSWEVWNLAAAGAEGVRLLIDSYIPTFPCELTLSLLHPNFLVFGTFSSRLWSNPSLVGNIWDLFSPHSSTPFISHILPPHKKEDEEQGGGQEKNSPFPQPTEFRNSSWPPRYVYLGYITQTAFSHRGTNMYNIKQLAVSNDQIHMCAVKPRHELHLIFRLLSPLPSV